MAKLGYEVRIGGADNGILVNVGCKTLVFKNTEIDEFLADLKTLITAGEGKLREKYYPEEMVKNAYLGGPNLRTTNAADCGQAECAPQCAPGY